MFKKVFMGVVCIVFSFMFSGCENKILTPTYEQTVGEYVLNISANLDTFSTGEDIEVTMVFENNSGQDQVITHKSPLVYVFVVGHAIYNEIRVDVSNQSTLLQGITTSTATIGSQLEKGRHELVAKAVFSLQSEPLTEDIVVISNTIFLTVK